jgi:hypothetical protein
MATGQLSGGGDDPKKKFGGGLAKIVDTIFNNQLFPKKKYIYFLVV